MPRTSKHVFQRKKQSLTDFQRLLLKSSLALILGIPLFIMSMLGKTQITSGDDQIFWIFIGFLVLLVMIYSGGHFYKAAWTSFKAHNANMNTLIALATLPAWIYSIIVAFWPSLVPHLAQNVYFDAPMTVIGLLVLGAALEIRAGEKASKSIEELEHILPKKANLLKDDKIYNISVDKIKPKDLLSIAAGEVFPVDGEVIKGETKVDTQKLNGETQSIEVKAGMKIYAGTKNLTKTIIIETKQTGKNTALKKIIQIIKKAQNTKPAISAIADKIASVFAPSVLIIAFITLAIWLNFGPSPKIAYTLITFMAVLLIACPCALGLAAPISSTVGISKASQAGIIFHNSNIFTELANTKTLVLTFIPQNMKKEMQTLKDLGLKLVFLPHKDNPESFDAQQFEFVKVNLKKKQWLETVNELAKKEKIAIICEAGTINFTLTENQHIIHIAMGLESYADKNIDIGILTTNFSKFIDAFKLTKATLKNIKQNLSGAFLYNLLGIPIAAGILYPLVHALLSPILAGGFMAASSLLVILNANRLHFFTPRRKG